MWNHSLIVLVTKFRLSYIPHCLLRQVDAQLKLWACWSTAQWPESENDSIGWSVIDYPMIKPLFPKQSLLQQIRTNTGWFVLAPNDSELDKNRLLMFSAFSAMLNENGRQIRMKCFRTDYEFWNKSIFVVLYTSPPTHCPQLDLQSS